MGIFFTEIAELKLLKKADIANNYTRYESNKLIPGNEILENIFNYLTTSDDLKKSFLEKVNNRRSDRKKEKGIKTAETTRKKAIEKNLQKTEEDENYYYGIFQEIKVDKTFSQMLDLFRDKIPKREIARRADISEDTIYSLNTQAAKIKILQVFIKNEEKIHEIMLHFFKQERDENFKAEFIYLLENSQMTPFLEKAKEIANVSLSEISYLMNNNMANSTIHDQIKDGRPSNKMLELLVPEKYLETVITKISKIKDELKKEATPPESVALPQSVSLKKQQQAKQQI